MEVHHPPHAEKKGFKEYFLEFLMLFLAVTLGFFAENLREHLNNNEDTRKSMQAILNDLRADSIMYKTVLSENEYASRMIDTLITLLGERNTHTNHIYFLARNITAVTDVIKPNTRTFEQLKSAGSLKLIKKQDVLNRITSYYQSLKWFDVYTNLQTEKLNEVHLGNAMLFDATIFQKMTTNQYTDKERTTLQIKEPENNPPFLNNDPISVNTVILRFHYLGSLLKENNGVAKTASESCERLIEYIEKEYK